LEHLIPLVLEHILTGRFYWLEQ
jgi:PAX-interacting protein 1